MEKLELTYASIAKEIQCDYFGEGDGKEITSRLNYLIGQLEASGQYIPDAGAGTELEYALGDIENLLNTILFKL
tara:strand:+ start:174 stop:395 length:222 start_codon:yes stop_codon:yes gene_type:complete